jgi:hypothetical protein
MNDREQVLRRISWRDLFPWLILFRTFRIAISPTLLAVSTLAVLLTPLGWIVADLVFQPPRAVRAAPPAVSFLEEPFAELRRQRREALRSLGAPEGGSPAVPDVVPEPAPEPAPEPPPEPRVSPRERVPRAENSLLRAEAPLAPREYLPQAQTPVVESYLDFAEPLARFFRLSPAGGPLDVVGLDASEPARPLTFRDAAFYLCGTLWMLLVWALPGGFITRRAVVELATESPSGLRESAEFAWSRVGGYFLAPLYPLVGILALTLPIAVLGLFVWISLGLGSVLAGILWIFVAVAGLAAMWLLVGLIFGWPLMWPAISAERDGDAFEAFQRSYSYVYSKPLHYFFYFVLAALFGALCWAVVLIAAAVVREFGFWALSWGGGGQQVSRLRELALNYAATGRMPSGLGALSVGATLVGLVVALIDAVAAAFRYTFFFTAASAIYLLLRHDVDEKEMDEIWLGPRDAAPPPAAGAEAMAGAAGDRQQDHLGDGGDR